MRRTTSQTNRGGSFARSLLPLLILCPGVFAAPASASFEVRPGAIGRWPHLPSELPAAFAWRTCEAKVNVAVLHLDPFAMPGLGLDAVALRAGRGAWTLRAVGSRLALADYAEWTASASIGHVRGARELWIEATALGTSPDARLREQFGLEEARAFALALGLRQRVGTRTTIEAWGRDLAASPAAGRLGVARVLGGACAVDLSEQCGLRWGATRGGGRDRVEFGLTLRPARGVALHEEWTPRASSTLQALQVRSTRAEVSCWSAEIAPNLAPSRGVALDLALGRGDRSTTAPAMAKSASSPRLAANQESPMRAETTPLGRDPLEAWEGSEASGGAFDLASLDSLRDAGETSEASREIGDPAPRSPSALDPAVRRYLDAHADSVWSVSAAPDSMRARLRALAPYLSTESDAAIDVKSTSALPPSQQPADRAGAFWRCRESAIANARSGVAPARRGLLETRYARGALRASGSWRHDLETGWGEIASGGNRVVVGNGVTALSWGEGLVAPRTPLGAEEILRPRRQGTGRLLASEQTWCGGPLTSAVGAEGERHFLATRYRLGRGAFGLLLSREAGGPPRLSAMIDAKDRGRLVRLEVARIGHEAALRVGAHLRVEGTRGRSRLRAELARTDVTRWSAAAAPGFVRETRVQTSLRHREHSLHASLTDADRPLRETPLGAISMRRDLRGQLAVTGPMPHRGRWGAEAALFRRREVGRDRERIDLRLDLRAGSGLLLEWARGGERRSSGPRVREAFTLGRRMARPRGSLHLALFAVQAGGAPSPRWLALRQSASRGLYLASRGAVRRGPLSLDLKLLHGLERSVTWGELRLALTVEGAAS